DATENGFVQLDGVDGRFLDSRSDDDGTASTTIAYTVSANPTSTSRTGTIAVGGWPGTALYTVTQDAVGGDGGGGTVPQCFATVSPGVLIAGVSGSTATLAVTAAPGCTTLIDQTRYESHQQPTLPRSSSEIV